MRYLILPLILAIGCSAAKQPPQPMTLPKLTSPPRRCQQFASSDCDQRRRSADIFDDGLSQIYAFNHDEAIKQFTYTAHARSESRNGSLGHRRQGEKLTTTSTLTRKREKEAATEMQKATTLAQNAPQVEKDYVAALSKRFSGAEKPDLKKLGTDYAAAMEALMNKYPDDLDAATLYADAMMCLRPWRLYALDGTPADGTDKIVAALESVLKRDPDHVGANHLYIHAVEASKHPERALEAAARLPLLAPSCGHLVHMPSHVYSRVGDQESAATSNEAAVNVDRDYFAAHPDMTMGPYNMMYYSHNMHFLAYAEMECGNYANAKKWAMNLTEHVKPCVAKMQMLEVFLICAIRRGSSAAISGTTSSKSRSPTPKPRRSPPSPGTSPAAWPARERATSPPHKPSTPQCVGQIHALPADTGFGPLNSAKNVFAVATVTLYGEIEAAQKYWPPPRRSSTPTPPSSRTS